MNPTDPKNWTKADRFMLSRANRDFFFQLVERDIPVDVREAGERLEVVILVKEDAVSDDLHNSIPYALLLRDRLIEYQGRLPTKDDLLLLSIAEAMNKNQGEISYALIARYLNSQVARYLEDEVELLRDLDAYRRNHPDFKDWFEWAMKHPKINARSDANEILRAVRLRSEEIELLLEDGIANIKAGKRAFEKGYPISREKLIHTLKYWRASKRKAVLEALRQIEEAEARLGLGADTPFNPHSK